jgi:catechol 2,3-dioxygenase-like lactoylglutathione lyase family enzyme
MLSTTRLVAIVPVRDLDRAREFYEHTLGLSPGVGPDPEGVLFGDDGHSGLQLLLRPDAPAGACTSAPADPAPDAAGPPPLHERWGSC